MRHEVKPAPNDDIIEIKIRRQGVDWPKFKRIMLNLVTPFPEHREAKQTATPL